MHIQGAKTSTSAKAVAAGTTESIKPSTPTEPKPQPSNEEDLEIAKMVQQRATLASSPRKGTSDEPMIFHIWDFAGNDAYYTTHQVCFIQPFSVQLQLKGKFILGLS